MNCSTGHLIVADDLCFQSFSISSYTPIPDHLWGAASQFLDGRKEAMVSLLSGGKLSKWAKSERKKQKKQAKASSRRNRN